MGGWALAWLVHAHFLSLIGETNGGATCLCKASWGRLLGCHAVLLQSDKQTSHSSSTYIGPGVKTNHSAGLLVCSARPPCLYMYLPWTWPPFPYLPTQKATTPFSPTYLDGLDYLLDYLYYLPDLNHTIIQACTASFFPLLLERFTLSYLHT